MDIDSQEQRERIAELENAQEEAKKLRAFGSEIEACLLGGNVTSEDVYRIVGKLAQHHTNGDLMQFLLLTTLPGQLITAIIDNTLSQSLARGIMEFFRQFVNDYFDDLMAELRDEERN